MEEEGISIAHHRTQRACASLYDQNDIILTMRDEQTDELCDSFPDLNSRVYSLSGYLASKGMLIKDDKGRVISLAIPDPEGENYATCQQTIKALEAWLRILLKAL